MALWAESREGALSWEDETRNTGESSVGGGGGVALKARGKFAGTRASEKDAAPGRPAPGTMRPEF